MFRSLILAGCVVGATGLAASAQSANCALRNTVVERLSSVYSEQLTAGGLQTGRSSQNMVEVWSSPETGTFTVMMTNAAGVSCIMAAGTNWFHDTVLALPEGTPS